MNRRSPLVGTPSRTKRLVLLAGLLVGLVATAAWALLSGRDDKSTAKGKSQRSTSSQAAMSDMEGMDNMAGMNMSSDGSVKLTADQIRRFGVTFGTADQRPLSTTVRTVGIVAFDETRIAQVAPRFNGFVERLHVNFTGQRVRRGQPLLEVYSPELVAAQEELLLARQLQQDVGESAVPGIPAGSSDLVASAKRRLELWNISEAQVDEILRTGKVRRSLTLQSPASGIVVEQNVREGQAFQEGQTLYTITDLSEVWIEAELREADVGQVREGSPATIELAAYPGRPFEGRVEYVYPTLQQEARTLKARVAVKNPKGLLKPGMYATVRVTTPADTALTVPSPAVIRTGERALVFVDMGPGGLMPHEVELGRAGEEYTEVLAGIEPGQRVVTSAQFLLESESNLAEVMKGAMSQMGMSDMGKMEGMDMEGMEGMKGMDKGSMNGGGDTGTKRMPGMKNMDTKGTGTRGADTGGMQTSPEKR